MRDNAESAESGYLKITADKFGEFMIKCPDDPIDRPVELPAGWVRTVDPTGQPLYVDLHWGTSQYAFPTEELIYNNNELYEDGEVPNIAETFVPDDPDLPSNCPRKSVTDEEEVTFNPNAPDPDNHLPLVAAGETPPAPPEPLNRVREDVPAEEAEPEGRPDALQPAVDPSKNPPRDPRDIPLGGSSRSTFFLQDSSNATEDPDDEDHEDYKVLLANLRDLKHRFATHRTSDE